MLISTWYLHPYDHFRHPFCSHGSKSFCSRNEYVCSVTIEVKIFNQKLDSLSSPADLSLCDFFSEHSTSFNSVSSYSYCSVSLVLSSSLLIHSASSLCSFSLLKIFFQNFSTSFIEGGSLISMGCFPISRYNCFVAVLNILFCL